jgi:acetoin utilization deacetylase AcuC-like enzyme
MTSLLVHDEAAFLRHDTGPYHPERPERIRAVERELSAERFQLLQRAEAPRADFAVIERVHPHAYVSSLEKHMPEKGLAALDAGDTVVSPGSWEAVLRGVGAAVHAVDEVMQKRARNAFCASRPPGHHAEPERAMGFCLFNNAAIAAFHARAAHGAKRVAVADFDVHHGNGTQAIFWSDPDMLYASSHQMPLFPGTGAARERGESGNIVNAPLRGGDGAAEFRKAWETVLLPALRRHQPDLLIISAGFDAHRADPLGGLNLTEADFSWVTRELMAVADECCEGRLVSVLEGGYDIDALAHSAGAHVQALCEAL